MKFKKSWLCYISITIAVLIILYYVSSPTRLDAGRIYHATEAKRGVAIDRRRFYAVGDGRVGKYSRKTGRRLASKKVPFRHLRGGKIVEDQLVVVDTSAKHPKMIWLDPLTLDVAEISEIPDMHGTITWFDWAWGGWWIGVNHKDETAIYRFTPDWILEGYWKLSGAAAGVSGGAWFGEWLCVAIDGESELHVLELPEKKIHAKRLRTVNVCFEGGGFAFERGKNSVYVWGTRDGVVVRCAINLGDE